MSARIQHRRGTSAQWTSANPILADGEFGIEKDTGVVKIGDGVTAWNDLLEIHSSRYLATDGAGGWTLNGDPVTIGGGSSVPPSGVKTGVSRFIGAPDVNSSGSSSSIPLNTMTLQPIVIPADCSVDQIALEVTSIGSTSDLRVGIYTDDGSYSGPSTLLATSEATTPGTSTGVKSITLPEVQALVEGLYWIACVAQGGAAPTLRSTIFGSPYVMSTAYNNSSAMRSGYSLVGVSGALPSSITYTDLSTNNVVPRINLRVV